MTPDDGPRADTATRTSLRSDARDGLVDVLPVLATIVPFAALYGALATAQGFTAFQTLLASGAVYAGASQYLMLDMLGQGLPEAFGLDFILPLYFLAIVLGFRASPGFTGTLAVAATASVAVHATLGPPWHILSGAAAGLACAAATARPPDASADAIVLGGPAEIAAALVAGLAGLRLSATWVVALGLVALVAARRLGG